MSSFSSAKRRQAPSTMSGGIWPSASMVMTASAGSIVAPSSISRTRLKPSSSAWDLPRFRSEAIGTTFGLRPAHARTTSAEPSEEPSSMAMTMSQDRVRRSRTSGRVARSL